jgi:hypothetical protein
MVLASYQLRPISTSVTNELPHFLLSTYTVFVHAPCTTLFPMRLRLPSLASDCSAKLSPYIHEFFDLLQDLHAFLSHERMFATVTRWIYLESPELCTISGSVGSVLDRYSKSTLVLLVLGLPLGISTVRTCGLK